MGVGTALAARTRALASIRPDAQSLANHATALGLTSGGRTAVEVGLLVFGIGQSGLKRRDRPCDLANRSPRDGTAAR